MQEDEGDNENDDDDEGDEGDMSDESTPDAARAALPPPSFLGSPLQEALPSTSPHVPSPSPASPVLCIPASFKSKSGTPLECKVVDGKLRVCILLQSQCDRDAILR